MKAGADILVTLDDLRQAARIELFQYSTSFVTRATG